MMTNWLRVTGVLCLTYLVCSCGSGGKENPINPNPKSPEEALNSLSQKHREAFENWKTRLVKSCNGSEAFGTEAESTGAELGLDLPAFFKKNGRSLVVAEGNEVALLGAPNTLGGVSTSKIESTEEVNGKSYTLQAELKREGYRCTVVLYGQKVHETQIAKNVDLIGYWNGDKSGKINYRKTTIAHFGVTQYSEVKNHGINEAFAGLGNPSDKAFRLIASRFGIVESKVPAFFRIYPGVVNTGASAVLVNETSTAWFGGEYPRLLLSSETSKKLLDNSPQNIEVEWRVRIPQIGFGDLKNDADAGALRFNSTIQISKKQPENGDYGFFVVQLNYQGVKAFDLAEASQCVSSRAKLFKLVDSDSLGLQVRPTLPEAVGPCRSLSADTDKLVLADSTLKSLIPGILRGISPTKNTHYNGWDGALSSLALETLEKGLDIASDLDPQGASPIIAELSKNLASLKAEFQKSANLLEAKQLIYQMGIDWALTGQLVSQTKMGRILAGADNAWTPFKVSTEYLLRELARDSNTNEAAIAFASSIDASYKSEATRTLAIARALDYSEWEGTYFNQVLQKQVPVEEFKKWSERLGKIQTELTKYPAVQKIKGSLTRLTIKWLESGEAGLEDVGKVYGSLSNSFAPFEESTNQLVKDLAQSYSKNLQTLDFANSISADYKRIAVSVRDKAAAIGFENWAKRFFGEILQKRPSLLEISRWEATLVAATLFTQREHTRMQGESEFFNEGYRKDLIETALKEVWDGGEFSQMEQIASVGKFKTTCGNYKGVSSIANCVGRSLFSRSTKKFFDPTVKGRYGALSSEFESYMGMLQPENEYYSMRSSLISAFFGSFEPLWASCADTAYETKARELRNVIPAYAKETDQIKKWEMERAIRKTLENCSH